MTPAVLDDLSITSAGIWQPNYLFGIQTGDTSLGDAWVINPADFVSGNPVTSPGSVVIRPVVTEQTGLHVEFQLTCLGCASLAGTVTSPIDKTNPANVKWQQPVSPVSLYNYNAQTAAAQNSIPLYHGSAVDLACSNCYLALQQSGLYLAVTYGGNGFGKIQVEADVGLLANLDLTLTVNGNQDSSHTSPVVPEKPIFQVPLIIAKIGFNASIDYGLDSISSLQGSGNLLVTAGKHHFCATYAQHHITLQFKCLTSTVAATLITHYTTVL